MRFRRHSLRKELIRPGWAYTLLIENVILNNSAIPPYKAFLFQGHVLDEKGGKMSKSKGNVLEGSELLQRYPADLIRLYFMGKASPIEPLSFSTDEPNVKAVPGNQHAV